MIEANEKTREAVRRLLEKDAKYRPRLPGVGRANIGHMPGRCDSKPDDIEHLVPVVRYRVNGSRCLYVQCARCGAGSQFPQNLCINMGRLPEWDEELHKAGYESYREQNEREYYQRREEEEKQKEAERTERRAHYESYIRSPEWKARRAKVLLRAGGVCECCGERRAINAHHTTYDNLGNEPLWELRAVCEECHETLHPWKITTTTIAR